VRDAAKEMLLSAGAILIPTVLLWCSQWTTVLNAASIAPVEQQTEQITIRDDEDDPEVWATANSFERAPTPENTRQAFRILDEKLGDWAAHPAGVITTILHAIGDHRVQGGRQYLIRFLLTDPGKSSSGYLASIAALALGDLGGQGALEALQKAVAQRADEAIPSVAVALGMLKEPGAVPALEALAQYPDASVRRRALSALENYCAPTTRVLTLHALSDDDAGVRNAATWWLAACGTYQDGSYLAQQLTDSEPLVRSNALKGLTRLKSRAGCTSLRRLLVDESLTVREGAEAYKAVCKDT